MLSSLFGWVAYSVIVPSLAGTGVTVTDLILNKTIDPAKAKILQHNIDLRSAKMGNDATDIVTEALTKLFVPSNVAKISVVKNPPLNEKTINEIQAEAVQKGTEEGLQTMKDAEKQYEVIRKQSLATP